jgi:hypothetical protein
MCLETVSFRSILLCGVTEVVWCTNPLLWLDAHTKVFGSTILVVHGNGVRLSLNCVHHRAYLFIPHMIYEYRAIVECH